MAHILISFRLKTLVKLTHSVKFLNLGYKPKRCNFFVMVLQLYAAQNKGSNGAFGAG